MMVSAVVLQNLIYVIGAVAGIVVGGLAVTLRHRRPTSIEANVDLFNKGLRALAPEAGAVRAPSVTVSPMPRPAVAAPVDADLIPPVTGVPAQDTDPGARTPTEVEAG
jgi:hypothetical protein